MTRDELPQTAAEKAANAKVLASFEKAQKAHEDVMSGIAKAETAKFDRINEALNKSKESDPKDKLGNTVPSAQTKYLEAQLLQIMGQASQRGRQTATPAAAGIKPEQLDPKTGKLPVKPGARLQAPAAAPSPELRPAYRTPIKGTKMVHPQGQVILTGKSRVGPNGGQEVEASMGGKVGWVPFESLKPATAEGEGGEDALERFFNPPQREFQPF
jgi:hypothetical protein